jgi:p-aminobenzoyl-glutamate transporter AbgT
MKKVRTIGPVVCLILNILLFVSSKIVDLSSDVVSVIIFTLSLIGIAMAFVGSEGLNAHSLRGRLIILIHLIVVSYIFIMNFLHNISG